MDRREPHTDTYRLKEKLISSPAHRLVRHFGLPGPFLAFCVSPSAAELCMAEVFSGPGLTGGDGRSSRDCHHKRRSFTILPLQGQIPGQTLF